MKLKSRAIVGSRNEADARDILRQAGIQAVQQQAAFIPAIDTEELNMPVRPYIEALSDFKAQSSLDWKVIYYRFIAYWFALYQPKGHHTNEGFPGMVRVLALLRHFQDVKPSEQVIVDAWLSWLRIDISERYATISQELADYVFNYTEGCLHCYSIADNQWEQVARNPVTIMKLYPKAMRYFGFDVECFGISYGEEEYVEFQHQLKGL